MDKFEKLVNQIMKEAEADGEPVTREEAEEMARMEVGAKECAVTTVAPAEKKPRKKADPDAEKVDIIQEFYNFLLTTTAESVIITNVQREVSFKRGDFNYSIQLIRHRPPKAKD